MDYQTIKNAWQSENAAGIQKAVETRRSVYRVLNLTLTTAQDRYSPFQINFPFRGLWIQNATDSTAEISFIANEKKEGELNDPISLKRNDFVKADDYLSGGQLYWSAQSGKTMTVVVCIEGEVKPGSLISQTSGGVNITEGSAIDTSAMSSTGDQSSVSVGTTATIIWPTDTDAKSRTVYNAGGATVWLGDSSVVATAGSETGIPLLPGDTMVWKNTAALYGIVVAGTCRVTGNHEE